jgi:3-hydroxybutyryl-CoA dehydrogenase
MEQRARSREPARKQRSGVRDQKSEGRSMLRLYASSESVMADEIKRVGVVGLGVMGFDIALLYAMKGYRTLGYDASSAAVASFAARLESTSERLKRRNRIGETEIHNLQTRLTLSASLDELADLDLVTEAVAENVNTKASVYRSLTEGGFKGILTTNTSAIPRGVLLKSESCDRKKFANTHFFNPVLYTQIVEIVHGDMEQAAIDRMLAFLKSLGRNPVVTQDISGFVSNSVLMYYAVMALRLIERGARIEGIDATAKQMGLLPPFISFDSWKPSIVEDVTRVMFDNRGDSFLRSSDLLRVIAQDNPRFYLDQKPNREIYNLVPQTERTPGEDIITAALRVSVLIAAARVAELGEDPRTVDFVSVEGLKLPRPPLAEIDEQGVGVLMEELNRINLELPHGKLPSPEILTAMADERESFYRNGQPNPWIISFLERQKSHAGD